MKSNLVLSLKNALLFFILLSISSCSSTKKVAFNNSPMMPGAEGEVKVKKDNNSNYHIEVNVVNLVDPKKLTPSKNTYIVWIGTNEKGPKNIGQIHSSSSMFSKAKKASITTVSPLKPVKVFITAEDNPNVETPGEQVVLSTAPF